MRWRKEKRLMREASELLGQQQTLLERAVREITVWQDLALEMTRRSKEIAVAMRVAQEMPEIDVRDDLDELIRTLEDQVAQIEEHVC